MLIHKLYILPPRRRRPKLVLTGTSIPLFLEYFHTTENISNLWNWPKVWKLDFSNLFLQYLPLIFMLWNRSWSLQSPAIYRTSPWLFSIDLRTSRDSTLVVPSQMGRTYQQQTGEIRLVQGYDLLSTHVAKHYNIGHHFVQGTDRSLIGSLTTKGDITRNNALDP